ncbi:Protein of unknown function [Gryllus bimaculatus]|nr:Protein of unknown function [Gryllus bimaculatus]
MVLIPFYGARAATREVLYSPPSPPPPPACRSKERCSDETDIPGHDSTACCHWRAARARLWFSFSKPCTRCVPGWNTFRGRSHDEDKGVIWKRSRPLNERGVSGSGCAGANLGTALRREELCARPAPSPSARGQRIRRTLPAPHAPAHAPLNETSEENDPVRRGEAPGAADGRARRGIGLFTASGARPIRQQQQLAVYPPPLGSSRPVHLLRAAPHRAAPRRAEARLRESVSQCRKRSRSVSIGVVFHTH